MKRKVLLAPNLSGQPSGNETLNLSSSSFPGQGEPNPRQPLRAFGVGAVVDGMEANGVCNLPYSFSSTVQLFIDSEDPTC